MRYISCKLDDLKKIVLPIGYEGENEHTRVQVDAGEVFKEYPAAVPSLKVHGPTGTIYPATVTRDGNSVIWDITASDCAADGSGEAQFTFTNNNVIVKSCIAKIKVYRSIVGGSTPPDPVQDWLDEAQDVLDDLEAAEVHQPMIGVDGYWYTWDQETGEYEKTETKAQGEDGQPGPAGQDGAPGQDATPALITVNYSDLTFPVAEGTNCYHDGLLYYAKQDIQTSEAWTAAHWQQTTVEEQQRLLLNDIQGLDNDKYEKPSGGIPATDMTEEVQNTLSAVGKSEERDGIVQTGDTATRNITTDQYVIWKGNLYTASANIATGETLSLSNLSPVSDGGFNALLGEIKQIGEIKAYKKYVQQEQSTGSVWIALDEPVDIEERDEIEILIYQSDKETSGRSWSNTQQWNSIAIQNKNNTSISLQDRPYLNSDRPAIKKIKRMDGYVIYQTISNNALTGLGVDFPNNFDSFKRIQLDPVSSTLKAGCTVEITVRKTI